MNGARKSVIVTIKIKITLRSRIPGGGRRFTNAGKENIMLALLFLNLIVPFVMVLVGVLLKRHPVSDMRTQNGYNTPASRKSQAHWDYAQQIAPDIYIFLGKCLFAVEIVLCVMLWLLRVPVGTSLIIGGGIGAACLFYGFYHTDRKIEEKFSDVS